LLKKKPAVIVETGTSAWGTDSTRLWSSYVKSFGGKFFSVDIRSEPRETLGDLGPLSLLFVDDSVNFLNNFNQYCKSKIDLVYLDSFDIDWENPIPAMQHGLKEFESVEKYLKIGSVVVIDDTPINQSAGKGALVLTKIKLQPDKYRIIYHNYNLVFEILN
jgi:cephalosporin hydroxylase